TRTHPNELTVERNRLQYRSRTDVSESLVGWLERALAPAAEDRYADAAEMRRALARLRGADAEETVGDGWAVDLPMEFGERLVEIDRPPDWLEIEQMTRDESVYTFSPEVGPETTVPFRQTTLRLSRRLVEIETTSPLGRNSLVAVGAAVLAVAAIEAWFLLFIPIVVAVTPPETTVRLGSGGMTRKSGLTVQRVIDEVSLGAIAKFDADGGAVRAIRRDGAEIPVTDGLEAGQAEWLAGILNDWLFE
ncbi:MAG: hypothetical protein ABEN55_12640, partial [Bradymonadaceae bacterium]